MSSILHDHARRNRSNERKSMKGCVVEAIEFQAEIINGTIQLPAEYAAFDNSRVKVIVLKSTPPILAAQKRQELTALFQQVAQQQVFQDISDPVAWQNQFRKSWE